MTLEMATVRRTDLPGAHGGAVMGVAWFGTPVTPWVEVGSFNMRADEIYASFAAPHESWSSTTPRLNLFEHKKPSVQEISAGVLLRWPTEGLRPFFRCGVGYYLDEILDFEYPPQPGGPPGFGGPPQVSSHSQWQAGINFGLGFQGKIKNSAISPVIEFRWQMTRLYEVSKSSLLSAHAGLWLRRE